MAYPFDIIVLLLSLMVLSGPGIIWSYIFFEKISLLERLMFGFILGVSFVIGSFFLLDMLLAIPLSQLKLQILVLVYWLVGFVVFALSRYYYRIRSDSDPLHLPHLDVSGWENHLLLFGILIVAFLLGLLPHLDGSYYIPLHVDEWIHWSYSSSVMETGSSSFVSPYTGSGLIRDLESGHHYLTAGLIWLSGVSMRTLFVFIPALLVCISSIFAYMIGENHKQKFGLIAALFVPLVPTTCRYLGPSFFVPVALGMVFILAVIWLTQLKSWWATLMLPGFLWIVFLIHPPTALAAIIAAFLGMVMLLFEKRYLLGGVGIIISLLPIVGVFALASRWEASLQQVIDAFIYGMNMGFDLTLPRVLVQFGYLSTVVWILAIIGVFAAFAYGSMATRTISACAMAYMGFIVLYDRFGYGIAIMYERSFLYVFLMICLLGAWGLVWSSKFVIDLLKQYYNRFSKKQYNLIHKSAIIGICILVLATAIPTQLEIPYYHLISESEFEDFSWLNEEIQVLEAQNISLEKGLIDPYKASPFSAVSRLHIISSNMNPIYGISLADEVREFLRDGCINQTFLDHYDIDVIYSPSCENENLTNIYENIYLVDST